MQGLLDVHLKTSRFAYILAMAIYGAAISALWVANVSFSWSLFLSICLISHGVFYSIPCLQVKHCSGIRFYNDSWRIRWDNEWLHAKPYDKAFITFYIMILPFMIETKKGGKRKRIVIFSDSAETSQVHGLRLNIVLNGFK